MDLSNKQKEAIAATEGPVLIIAGAGAGKTKVLTERVVHLIQTGIAPEKILAVTFTNKAAGEMKTRITKHKTENMLHASSFKFQEPLIGTFHALGLLMIKENIEELQINKQFSILDENDSLKTMKECVKELSLDIKQFDPSRMKHTISSMKNNFNVVEDFTDEGYFADVIRALWNLYESKKTSQSALDFDDLLLRPTKLLQENENVRKMYQERWQYIHIDEYQDTNEVQYQLTKTLASMHRNLFVVGDIDQAIYSWRGANFKNILHFKEDYPDATVITLEENYRSTAIILDAANAIIEQNTLRLPKNLWTKKKGGCKIQIHHAEDEKKEAFFVANEISILKKNVPLHSIAVLYRTNAQSRAVEEMFLMRKIPYRIIGGVKFYERKEIKDIIAYARLLQNPKDLISKKRIINIPPRGIGKVSSEKIINSSTNTILKTEELRKKEAFELIFSSLTKDLHEASPHTILTELIKKIGYKDYVNDGTEKGIERWNNIGELLGIAKKLPTLETFLEHISLFSTDDQYNKEEDKKERVGLMTVHSAKGLEFDAVFVVGLEEGLFPHNLSTEKEDLEEERRLCYVAITRARTHLYMTLAAQRAMFGDKIANIPSRFLYELPEHLLEVAGVEKTNEDEREIIIE